MNELKDYYQVLGLSRLADEAQIHEAYEQKSAFYANAPQDTAYNRVYASAQLNKLQEAHDILTNPDKKEAYDRDLMTALVGGLHAEEHSADLEKWKEAVSKFSAIAYSGEGGVVKDLVRPLIGMMTTIFITDDFWGAYKARIYADFEKSKAAVEEARTAAEKTVLQRDINVQWAKAEMESARQQFDINSLKSEVAKKENEVHYLQWHNEAQAAEYGLQTRAFWHYGLIFAGLCLGAAVVGSGIGYILQYMH